MTDWTDVLKGYAAEKLGGAAVDWIVDQFDGSQANAYSGSPPGGLETYTPPGQVPNQHPGARGAPPAGASTPARYAGAGGMVDRMGNPIAVVPQVAQKMKCPRGYVLANDPISGAPVCVKRAVAISLRLWSPRKKGPISAGDWSTFKKSAAVQKKLEGIARKELKMTRRSTRRKT